MTVNVRSMPHYMRKDLALRARGYSIAEIARATLRTRQAVATSLRTAGLAKWKIVG